RHVRKLQSDREKTTKRWTLTQYSVDHCRFRAATPNSFDAKHIELAFDAADVGICHHEIAEPRIYRAHPDPRNQWPALFRPIIETCIETDIHGYLPAEF